MQGSRDALVELNSDMLIINYSCAPSLEFDMAGFQVRVVKGSALREGDELSFFDPSMELEDGAAV